VTDFELIHVADRSALMKLVLEELGYEIWKVPLQVICPVHKLGQEQRPSARLYSEEDHDLWCFYCNKQYTPTEVWEAQRSVSRSEAARAILVLWPVAEGVAQRLARASRAAPVGPRGLYEMVLERRLKVHRGRASFVQYREWARVVDSFCDYIESLPESSRESALTSFLTRMDAALGVPEKV
jgi:hypothetical protein